MTVLEDEGEALDRRMLLKVAAGGMVAGGLAAAAPLGSSTVEAASVPNNFRAVIHVTRQEDFVYTFGTLDTIAQHYKKASAQLVIDGDATKGLADENILAQLSSANDAGAEIAVASDALSINGIDPSTLPDYIDAGNPGVIVVVEAQLKGYHYYKI